MRTRMFPRRLVAVGLLLGAFAGPAEEGRAAAPEAPRVLIVAGPSRHPPGTHEVLAGARVIAWLLEHAEGIGPVRAEVVTEWPADRARLDDVATIVFTGDLFPGETLPDSRRVKSDLAALAARGCGMVCIHYATGLRPEHVAEDGDHPLLRWIGGYFSTGNSPLHKSVARVVTATLTPEAVDHPVLRGWEAFTFEDEPYWNNYFGPQGPAEGVTPLVSAMLPPEAPGKEIVAWAVERPDRGRGLGLVVPHFYRNWGLDDLRTLVLNGVCWTAKLDIPEGGIRSTLPELSAFEPGAVQPQSRPAKGQRAPE